MPIKKDTKTFINAIEQESTRAAFAPPDIALVRNSRFARISNAQIAITANKLIAFLVKFLWL